MTAESQPSQPVIPPDLPPLIFPEPKKRNKTVWIVLGTVVATLCIGMTICIALIGGAAGKSITERGPIEVVLRQFMQDMRDKDIDSAYSLFSPRAQRLTPKTKLMEMFEGNNYVLFDGYEGLVVRNVKMSSTVNINQDLPQGIVAEVTGIVTYSGGFEGKLQAVLEKVDTEWRLHYIYVTVPPDKLK